MLDNITACFKSKAQLVVENLCLRQQILVPERRHPRPRLQDQDRRFWILASRWGPRWQKSLSPQANAIAQRQVRSVRTECLDHRWILNKRRLRRGLAEYVTYVNRWRPHRSVEHRAPCAQAPPLGGQDREVITRSLRGGLHHGYDLAA